MNHRNLTLIGASLCAMFLSGSLSAQAEGDTPKQQETKEAPAKQAERKKPAPATPFEIGQTIPKELALPTIDGKTRSFGDLRGKVVFVHFWSITCPWEKHAEPVIVELEKTYKDKPVVIVAINANQNEIGAKPEPAPAEEGKKDKDTGEEEQSGDKAKPEPYANLKAHVKKTKGFDHEVLVDHGNAVSAQFGARTTPHCYVIDSEGVLRYAGALDEADKKKAESQPFVKMAIDAVLAGKEVEVPSTKPYG